MTDFNNAAKPEEERDNVNVDLAAAGISQKISRTDHISNVGCIYTTRAFK